MWSSDSRKLLYFAVQKVNNNLWDSYQLKKWSIQGNMKLTQNKFLHVTLFVSVIFFLLTLIE